MRPTLEKGKLDPERLLIHSRWVRALAHAIVADPNRADDAVQQTFLAALEQPPSGIRDVRAWLGGVLRRVVRQNTRAESRRRQRERRLPDPEAFPPTEHMVEIADQQQRVVRAVLDLREPYRTTLLLRFFEDRSPEAIARREGIPSSTVRNRIARGLDLLRERFEDEDPHWARGMAALAAVGCKGVLPMGFKAWALAFGLILAGGVGWRLIAGPPASAPPLDSNDSVLLAKMIDAPKGANPQDREARKEIEDEQKKVAREKPPEPRTIRGRVQDIQGRGIEGARVFISVRGRASESSPPSLYHIKKKRLLERGFDEWLGLSDERLRERSVLRGVSVRTDSEGRYAFTFVPGESLDREIDGDAAKVFAALTRSVGIRPTEGQSGFHQWSTESIDFTATRIHKTTVAIWATDRTTGKRLDEVRGHWSFGGGEDQSPWSSLGGRAYRREIEIRDGQEATIRVALREPPWARTEKDVRLQPGIHRDIELSVESGEGWRGQIVDVQGRPIKDAIVFWGKPSRLKRGRLVGDLDPSIIFDGVRTDELGSFVLPGHARQWSAYHEAYSPATDQVGDDARLVLPPRGHVQGRYLGEDGLPEEGAEIKLNGKRATTTDASGRFRFQSVEAGTHHVRFPGRQSLIVQVTPGKETDDVINDPWIHDVKVAVTSGGQPYLEKFGGALLGLDPISSLHEFGAREGSTTIGRLRPGTFLMIGARSRLAVIKFEGEHAHAEIGTATLTISAPPDARVYVVPKNAANDDTIMQCSRFAQKVPRDGTLVLRPLNEGTYLVGLDDLGIVGTVDVRGSDTRLDLR